MIRASVADFRALAKRRLPKFVFDYMDGGAGSEAGIRRNEDAFDEIQLTPRMLINVEKRDLSTTLFGKGIDWYDQGRSYDELIAYALTYFSDLSDTQLAQKLAAQGKPSPSTPSATRSASTTERSRWRRALRLRPSARCQTPRSCASSGRSS